MRKSIDGLAAMVSCSFKLDPFSDSLFVFCNRGRNKLCTISPPKSSLSRELKRSAIVRLL